MKKILAILIYFYPCLLIASPQFGVCAFDAELLEKPIEEGKKYKISFLPFDLIYIQENGQWQNDSALCPKLNEKYIKVVYLPYKDAADLARYPIGKKVRIVREYVDGWYVNGEVFDTEEYKLLENTDHKVNKSIKKDAASGALY